MYKTKPKSKNKVRDNGTKHPHLAVRSLPQEIVEHYSSQSSRDNDSRLDDIVSSMFYLEGNKCIIEVDDDYTTDLWQWQSNAYHIAASKLPKQIDRYYKQSQRINKIQSVLFHQNDDIGTVEVDLGPTLEIWNWIIDESNNNFKIWKLTETKYHDEQPIEIDVDSQPILWKLISSDQ